MDPITLDQLRVFLAVVDEGSFSAAARRLRRAQSAVSYAVANLERLLGVTLFDRAGRTPSLTEAGHALRADARTVTRHVEQLHARARSLSDGLEPVVSLAVDMMFPMEPLLTVTAAFREAFPHVSLQLHTEALGAVSQLVLDGVCRVGISAPLPRMPDELARWPIGTITMVQVAAPQHPLAKHKGSIPTRALREHTQLVISDRSTLTAGVDLGVFAAHTWRLADLSTKHAFLRAGLGWGSMPVHVVSDDLARGKLVRLRTTEGHGEGVAIPMSVVFRESEPPGPAARWLLERLGAWMGTEGGPVRHDDALVAAVNARKGSLARDPSRTSRTPRARSRARA